MNHDFLKKDPAFVLEHRMTEMNYPDRMLIWQVCIQKSASGQIEPLTKSGFWRGDVYRYL
jgi:hypothetical protein